MPEPGLSAVDPVEAVRSHPRWFFRSGRFEAETAIHLLIVEASLSPVVRRAQFERQEDWVAVSADGDWLEGNLEAFTKPTAFPEGGVNATRVEVVLTAFCEAVLTARCGQRHDVRTTGAHPVPGHMADMLKDPANGHVVIFRVPSCPLAWLENLHVDIVWNDWTAETQRRLAKVFDLEDVILSTESLDGSYRFKTGPHTDEDCPFVAGNEVPMRSYP